MQYNDLEYKKDLLLERCMSSIRMLMPYAVIIINVDTALVFRTLTAAIC